MPMAINAAKNAGAPIPPAALAPVPTHGARPAPLPSLPPPGATPMPPAGGLPAMPAPGAPAAPPYKIKPQADGTLAVVFPSPDGNAANDVISQVLPAPKIPPAFQAPKQPVQ